MDAKSRRNRRNISPASAVHTGPVTASSVTGEQTSATPQIKHDNHYISGLKAAAPAGSKDIYVYKELKWIGIITGIVLIVLIIFYIFLS